MLMTSLNYGIYTRRCTNRAHIKMIQQNETFRLTCKSRYISLSHLTAFYTQELSMKYRHYFTEILSFIHHDMVQNKCLCVVGSIAPNVAKL